MTQHPAVPLGGAPLPVHPRPVDPTGIFGSLAESAAAMSTAVIGADGFLVAGWSRRCVRAGCLLPRSSDQLRLSERIALSK